MKQQPPPPAWRSPRQRALALGKQGQHLPSGFGTLDRATRGGLVTGKFVVLGGAPGAGKTTLLVQLAKKFASAGYAVAILAADEDADGLLIRFGQDEGISRDDLERGLPAAQKHLAERLSELPNFHLVDAEEERHSTIDEVAIGLAALSAKGQPSVLLIDSLQTARTRTLNPDDAPRARIDDIVKCIKRVAKRFGHLVIATCELSRAAYRSQNDRIDDLAAPKESGGIEYAATALFILRSVKGEDELVDVACPKNRMGQKLNFRLKLNYRLASFTEVALPDEATPQRQLESLDRKILECVRRLNPKSKNAIFMDVGGGRNQCLERIDTLIQRGLVALDGGVFSAVDVPETNGRAS